MEKVTKKPSNITIVPYLYTVHSVKELLDEYIKALRKTESVEDMMHANKLIEIHSILFDNTFLSMIKKHYGSLYSLTKKEYPKLKFYLEGRRKSVLGCEKKINLFMSQGRILDEFRDVLAFRFILFNSDINLCYKLMETVIKFNIKHEFQPCTATPTFQTEGFAKDNFPGIQVLLKIIFLILRQADISHYMQHFRIQRLEGTLKCRLETLICIYMQSLMTMLVMMHIKSKDTVKMIYNLTALGSKLMGIGM